MIERWVGRFGQGARPLALGVSLLLAGAGAGLAGLSDYDGEDYDTAAAFVLNNSYFFVYHEVGHMLVSEFELPVLGKEEDAVDMLATVLLLSDEDAESDQTLMDSAEGWMISAEVSKEEGYVDTFWGAHALDPQRAFQIVCMMVGKDAEKFSELADQYELPQDRRDSCSGDFEQAATSWNSLLETHLHADDFDGETNIEVVYDEVTDPELKEAYDLIVESEMLDYVASYIGTTYQLEDGIVFKATSCGEDNAYWDPSARQVTFCYELANYYISHLDKYMKAE